MEESQIGAALGFLKSLRDQIEEVRWTPLLGQDRDYVKIGSHYPQGV